MTASHATAQIEREAAGRSIVPLRLPLAAVEWSCHAATTIKDAAGEVLAECSGHGRLSDEDVLIAAEIVRRVNAHDELVAVLQDILASSQCDPNRNRTNEGRWLTINARREAVERARAAIAAATGEGQ